MPIPVCRTVQEAYDAGRADALRSEAGTPELASKVAELLAPLLQQIAAQPPPLLSVVQAAEVLGITRRYMYELISAGEITTIRLPSRNGNTGEHRIERAELDSFIERHRQARRYGELVRGPAGHDLITALCRLSALCPLSRPSPRPLTGRAWQGSRPRLGRVAMGEDQSYDAARRQASPYPQGQHRRRPHAQEQPRTQQPYGQQPPRPSFTPHPQQPAYPRPPLYPRQYQQPAPGGQPYSQQPYRNQPPGGQPQGTYPPQAPYRQPQAPPTGDLPPRPRRRKRSRWPVYAGIAALLVIAGGGAAYALAGHRTGESSAAKPLTCKQQYDAWKTGPAHAAGEKLDDELEPGQRGRERRGHHSHHIGAEDRRR